MRGHLALRQGIHLFGVNLTILCGIAKGSRPLPGFGVSPKNFFFSFCSPPQVAREEKEAQETPLIRSCELIAHSHFKRGEQTMPATKSQLTDREREVLCLLATGHTDRKIAESLTISPRTVNRHMCNIFVKLEVPSRAAAAAHAVRRGII
jgi:DNA-binding CsgD family transcriptional regulator